MGYCFVFVFRGIVMICYRDRSYCSAADICATTPCDRRVDDEVMADAERWWEGFNSDDPVPIAYMDLSTVCLLYKEKKDD